MMITMTEKHIKTPISDREEVTQISKNQNNQTQKNRKKKTVSLVFMIEFHDHQMHMLFNLLRRSQMEETLAHPLNQKNRK